MTLCLISGMLLQHIKDSKALLKEILNVNLEDKKIHCPSPITWCPASAATEIPFSLSPYLPTQSAEYV